MFLPYFIQKKHWWQVKKGHNKNELYRTLGEEILIKYNRQGKVKMFEILNTTILWFETNSEVALFYQGKFSSGQVGLSVCILLNPPALCTYMCIIVGRQTLYLHLKSYLLWIILLS